MRVICLQNDSCWSSIFFSGNCGEAVLELQDFGTVTLTCGGSQACRQLDIWCPSDRVNACTFLHTMANGNAFYGVNIYVDEDYTFGFLDYQCLRSDGNSCENTADDMEVTCEGTKGIQTVKVEYDDENGYDLLTVLNDLKYLWIGLEQLTWSKCTSQLKISSWTLWVFSREQVSSWTFNSASPGLFWIENALILAANYVTADMWAHCDVGFCEKFLEKKALCWSILPCWSHF